VIEVTGKEGKKSFEEKEAEWVCFKRSNSEELGVEKDLLRLPHRTGVIRTPSHSLATRLWDLL